ncbi:uncharacterized protein TRUGW13939_08104 [Talaromyces rugulosus]|uniref:Enoyl reductase (ER) domain-containing protein n=1 Tax=Talaromyces rugulosus TaxID=121627 RepID=A0A7H8R4P3_TALRU|nr:uncharacterized protein TRUGW13939_08104 [Talaromyces rugulosus]QKX60958.1 hypothetical protein TRUGW13939_08104 [Talaromyces rugulosus]
MKAVVTKSPKQAVLVSDRPIPKLRDGYILVKTTAVALNPTDWKGYTSNSIEDGALVGVDYSGIVEEVGPNVSKPFEKGDHVAGFVHGCNISQLEDGAFAEYIVAKESMSTKVPDSLTTEQAATLGCGVSTVGQGLYEPGYGLELALPSNPIKTPEPLLIYGGSTATGTLGIQFAGASGYSVITTCSPKNFELVKSLGAVEVFDYNDPECGKKIKEYTKNGLKYAWDCVSTPEAAEICAQALTSEPGARYGTILGPKFPRDDVTYTATLAYRGTGEDFTKGGKLFTDNQKHADFQIKWWDIARTLLAAGRVRPHPLLNPVERVASQPENPFSQLITNQEIAIVPSFTLESGVTLYNVPIAYTSRGNLSPKGDNALVICHALSGSADVADWWGPLLGGPGQAFDVTRFFVICLNSLGSPYGSASAVTDKDGDPTKGRYGPEFPLTTVRDDVRIHRLVLDDLGVTQIAAVVGGSMGGMLTLEYAYFGKEYVRAIVPIATSARHSAWCISWGEAQRQSIYSDPKYEDGYYTFDDPPATGLGAARMSALLTYRSRNSFESRFGRNVPDPSKRQNINGAIKPPSPPSNEHWVVHNDGHKSTRSSQPPSQCNSPNPTENNAEIEFTDPQFNGTTTFTKRVRPTTYFSAQSYLRYQGEKFVTRFDSNCYIAITRKLDTHDISRHRASPDSATPVQDALAQIEQPALVMGIESDGLFTFEEQKEVAAGISDSRLKTIDSPEGHDAFLLQFEQVNRYILEFFREVLPDIMSTPDADGAAVPDGVGQITKNSTFGEAEVEDITAW